MHDHHTKHCEHKFKYCGHCDRPYCIKCKREWEPQCTKYHGTYYQQQTYPYRPYWTGTTGIFGSSIEPLNVQSSIGSIIGSMENTLSTPENNPNHFQNSCEHN